MLIFVVIWMTAIFSFSAGKVAYDKTDKNVTTINTQK